MVENISERLMIARKRAGFTQEELAERGIISVATIRRYEGGERDPKPSIIKKWAKATNQNYDWLMHSSAAKLA